MKPPDDNHGKRYTAESIKVVTWDQAVRRRPAMYFGCAQDNPALATAVLAAVIADALYEPDDDQVEVEVIIESDLWFTVTDTSATPRIGVEGVPDKGFADTIIDRRRWPLAAAAALSIRTTIEVACCGHRWIQDLEGMHPVGHLRHSQYEGRPSNQASFQLDSGYLAAGAVLSGDMDVLRGHWSSGERIVDITRLTILDRRRSDVGASHPNDLA